MEKNAHHEGTHADQERNQYETEEGFRRQRAAPKDPDERDGSESNEDADDRVRIEQPSGEEAPRA